MTLNNLPLITVPFGTDALIEAKDKMVALRPNLANQFNLANISADNPSFPFVFAKDLQGPSYMPEAMLGNNPKKLDERLEMNLLGVYATLGMWREFNGLQIGANRWSSEAGKGCRAIRSNVKDNGLFKEWVKTQDNSDSGYDSVFSAFPRESRTNNESELKAMDSKYTWVPNIRIEQADFSPFGKTLSYKTFPLGTHILSQSSLPDHSCWGFLFKEIRNWDKLTIKDKVSDAMPTVSLEIRTEKPYNRPPSECTYTLPVMSRTASLIFPFVPMYTNDAKYTLTVGSEATTNKYNCWVGLMFFDFANRELRW